ncbi:predicted protein, partial [Nematostella vectensis]
IFRNSIHKSVFPADWKFARVSPVFKKGLKTNLNNYRPISVISIVAKIYEGRFDQLYKY